MMTTYPTRFPVLSLFFGETKVKSLLKPSEEYIIAGDETVIGKAGKETHGLDRFFSLLDCYSKYNNAAGWQPALNPVLFFSVFTITICLLYRNLPK